MRASPLKVMLHEMRLKSKKILGAALDVFEKDSRFLELG